METREFARFISEKQLCFLCEFRIVSTLNMQEATTTSPMHAYPYLMYFI